MHSIGYFLGNLGRAMARSGPNKAPPVIEIEGKSDSINCDGRVYIGPNRCFTMSVIRFAPLPKDTATVHYYSGLDKFID
jgi:hypothetical protein